jgi:DNA-binding winged helix-turn-helix (wHTH) protein
MSTITRKGQIGLPPSDTVRWSPYRKAQIVNAVGSGAISLTEAYRRYQLSAEEFEGWLSAVQSHGVGALRVTRLGLYRPPADDDGKGLDSGADQFPTKPFELDGLVAKMQALIERRPNPTTAVVRVGRISIYPGARVVSVDGHPVKLTRSEYRVLELLGRRKDAVVSKEMLLAHLYDGERECDAKIIDVFIYSLRKKLVSATGGVHYIETVWGRGYMLREPASLPARRQRT